MSTALAVAEPGPAYEVAGVRRVQLYRLYQTQSYETALFGAMGRVTNKAIIEDALAFASEQLGFRGAPVLVPVHPGAGDGGHGQLPDILCIGEFMRARPARNASHMFSSATLIWFQDAFALPIAEPVLAAMRELEWPRIAEDWSA